MKRRRRNPEAWKPPGVSVVTSPNGRLDLRKTDDKKLPWVVVDLQEGFKVYFSDSKAKALSAMYRMAASPEYKTAADLARDAEAKERAIRSHAWAIEHGRQIASGEIVRGPIHAGVQIWLPAKKNPKRANANPRPLRVGQTVLDEYGNVGVIEEVPKSKGAHYWVMFPSGRAFMKRSEIRVAKSPRVNPKLTRVEFERRYWGPEGGGPSSVPASTRREFYSDYLESGQSFAAYKKSTSQPYPGSWGGK